MSARRRIPAFTAVLALLAGLLVVFAPAPAVAASLIAFIAVYFFVFGAGTFYILRLMARLPRDPMPDLDEGPLRSSGIMPGLAAHGTTHTNTQGGRHGV